MDTLRRKPKVWIVMVVVTLLVIDLPQTAAGGDGDREQ